MKIERTKQPDRLKYEGKDFEIRSYDDVEFAKELAKVLPKFLEEMEK